MAGVRVLLALGFAGGLAACTVTVQAKPAPTTVPACSPYCVPPNLNLTSTTG